MLPPDDDEKDNSNRDHHHSNTALLLLPPDKYRPRLVSWNCEPLPSPAPAPFSHLAMALELVSRETKRLKIIDILANTWRSMLALCPQELASAIILASNQFQPCKQCIERRGRTMALWHARAHRTIYGFASGR